MFGPWSTKVQDDDGPITVKSTGTALCHGVLGVEKTILAMLRLVSCSL